MAEINNSGRSPEAQAGPSRVSRRSILGGIGLFAAGVVGGFLTNELLEVDQDRLSPYELTEADHKRLEESRKAAEERAKELEVRINATVHTNEPVDITVLDEIYLPPVWKIDNPILLGDRPKISDVYKGFWFGMQFPDPGGIGRLPSVGVRAVRFDHRYMSLTHSVPAGQNLLATRQMEVLIMPPDPHMPPSDVMVAYAYNEFEPDHRQRNPNNRSQLVAPGLQIPVE
ncbi:MAG TPA: hypothetical protein VJ836_06165 [Candidatus Saccharimonadales bacterium]|nr:hypothetical protein [Candidatus Saccharimonadales bacterium]